ncbi:Uncharacterised protein [Candidatus Bilamarchaeum dharawalense]|uniref:DUF5518 domain-containing protein n=1 Tax=Candidatus Bilamarchaeum dharawalense TaxID=2885759 RepID=A0A5E4LVP7_9ARCH|nr:Uncharacterised protein [Candidatus Bilamarchaeum dharawalense]
MFPGDNVDFGKCIKAAILPTLAIIVLGIIAVVIGAIPFLSLVLCCVGWPMGLITLALLTWAGFNAGKEGQGMGGGAVAGLGAGLLSSIVIAILNFIVSLLGFAVGTAMGNDLVSGLINGPAGAIVLQALGIIFWAVCGLVLGVVGALVAGNK